MQRSIRSMAFLATACLAGMTLAACGSDGEAKDADGNVTIDYWLWDSLQQPAYQECATAFETANPGIKVKITQYGWDDYWSTLRNNFVSETAPDVFTDHVLWYPQFSEQGMLLDMAPQVEADGVDLSLYQDGLADLWVGKDGGRYGLPKDWDTVALFYNTELVEAAGYTAADLQELEWNPTDGGSYEALLAHLTVDENGVRGDEPGFDKTKVATYGLGLATAGAGFGQTENAPYTLSNGWYYVNENPWGDEFYYADAKYKEAIEWWRGLIEKGYMPSLEIAMSSDGIKDPFGAGKYAMVTEGDWNANSFFSLEGVTVGFAPPPIGPAGHRGTVFNGLADSIWAGTDHPDEAWKWVKFLGSAQCQDIVAEHAVVFPAIKTSSEKAYAAFEAKGMDMSAFTTLVEDGDTFLPPIASNWGEVVEILTPTMDSIMGFKEGTEALDPANDEVNALFQ